MKLFLILIRNTHLAELFPPNMIRFSESSSWLAVYMMRQRLCWEEYRDMQDFSPLPMINVDRAGELRRQFLDGGKRHLFDRLKIGRSAPQPVVHSVHPVLRGHHMDKNGHL